MTKSAVNVRALALSALTEILEEGAHSHIVIRQMLKKRKVCPNRNGPSLPV